MEISLGIDVGSRNVKACLLRDGQFAWAEVREHEGDLDETVCRLLRDRQVPSGTPALVTGREGRSQFALDAIIPPVAIEHALGALGLDVDAVVSVGGEDLVVYTVDGSRRIVNTYAGNKCASGTGEFFAQQLKRMDLALSDVDSPEVAGATAYKISSRCSVFLKSDCTHKLNKGEATKHDIALSLSRVMAGKVIEFLGKARIETGRVLLVGGVTRNPHVVRFVKEGLPQVEFVVPETASFFEAFGAAHLAGVRGRPIPPLDRLVGEGKVGFATGAPLSAALDLVTFVPSRRGLLRRDGVYVLGVDGGSTTTKAALVDMQTREIVASHYGRTLGDPVAALKVCLEAIRDQVRGALGEDAPIRIPVVATTGSSRELLGVFCQTTGIFNEIMAHAVGTAFYDPKVDTLFEIGGQDAKYVYLRSQVPIDYAMNEACSAGTGSFLEEAAAGDLDIRRAEEIGPIALEADAPLRFGEHCSAFINSDIRKAIQEGASRPNIVAGLVLSIATNYLNRVVGNRRIGERIVLQGGVARNPAVPLAFAQFLSKPVVVPPDPELMGCFGVSLLALEKLASGELLPAEVSLDGLIGRQIVYEKEFRCQSCDNYCPVKILRSGEERYPFGGRCNKYANQRHRAVAVEGVTDYVETRRQLYFEKHAPSPEALAEGPPESPMVAVPCALSVHSLWPLYANFFHELGARVRLVTEVSEEGATRCESSFCFPAEIAHGVTASMVEGGADFYFLPHFKAMPSYEKEIHACLCPIMQGLPYYLRPALDLDEKRILKPVLDFSGGLPAGLEAMAEVAHRMGFSRREAERAYAVAVERQVACYREGRQIGARAIEEAQRARRPVIVIFGRPYNALAGEANMGIPRKFTTRGYTILPYDFMPLGDEEILPNMYWYYGQQDLKAAVQVKRNPDLFACFVSNFSCAPDSFILHYLRWISNTKPFLVLELDSHTADAGLDTRIEAFLDIIEGYRRSEAGKTEPDPPQRDWDVVLGDRKAHVVNRRTGEKRALTHGGVRLLWPSMGRLSQPLAVQIARSYGIDSVALEMADVHTTARARAVASGKECIPALLVLGAFLDYFAKNPLDPERVYLLFMPLTTGPCRTGQYAIFYQRLFEELGYRNVVVLSLNSDTSYAELGSDFSRRIWWALVIGDYLRDAECALLALARDPALARREVEAVFREMVEASGSGSKALMRRLPEWSARLGRVPLLKPLAEARKVLVVGEIFVRRDEYSVSTLIDKLAENEIVAKVTGVTEWIHYQDWEQVRKLKKSLAAMAPLKRLFSRELRKLLSLRIDILWEGRVEAKVRRAFKAGGLVPPCPHGMDRIMARSPEFSTPELESEASLSPCVASLAMEEGYDGVAIISPFACLPGRLIEALYGPWARSRSLPVISIENDGNPYPPNTISRIDIFAHNVNRGLRGAWQGGPPQAPERAPRRASGGGA